MKNKLPNKTQKKYILNKLIPFIMREQGRGFGMSQWQRRALPKEYVFVDDVGRKTPACGTVCCIGGSMDFLKGSNRHNSTRKEIESFAPMLGLTEPEAYGLFFNWIENYANPGEFSWPTAFSKKFDRRKTPIGKARVACDLLRLIAKKGGAALQQAPLDGSEQSEF